MLILIILIIVAIIFRDRLRPYYYKLKSKFGKSKPGPKAPPRFSPRPGAPRRILPPSSRHSPVRRPVKRSGEIDDVLKKLKEMGK